MQRLMTPRKLDPNCTFTPRLDDYTLELLSPSRLHGGAARPSTAPPDLERPSTAKLAMPPPRPIPPSEFSTVAIAASGKSFLERYDDYTRLHRQVGGVRPLMMNSQPGK